MALVHQPNTHRTPDLAIIGLVLVVFGIIAVSIPCLKMAIDQVFAFFV